VKNARKIANASVIWAIASKRVAPALKAAARWRRNQQAVDPLSRDAGIAGQWIERVQSGRPPRTIVFDMESSVSPIYDDQEGTAYNGHFTCTCYHPLFLFNQFGDLERCALRSGNVHSAQTAKKET
jgi:hypothetical protein